MIYYYILIFFILVGCNPKHPKQDTTLRVSFNTQPHTTDPRKAGDFVSSTLICLLYEGLTRCLNGASVEPALAESYELSEDGKIYTFHLREAYWSDGSPILASDFERSWKEVISPAGACAYLFYPIKNAEGCARGNVPISEVGISAIDERTLRVELERPTPYFYSLTAFPSFLPIKTTVYSGPFIIEKMVNNSEILLIKNKMFWNFENISLDRIHISIIPDEMTALALFERGELDWLGGSLAPLPLDALEPLKSNDRVHFIPSAGTTFCTFNTQTFPFNHTDLRKAFSYAINRSEIALLCGQMAATRFIPPSLSPHTTPLFQETDPLHALAHFEQALTELKIERDFFKSLILYFRPTQMDKRVAQILQRQWKEVLGITIQIAQTDFKSHAQSLQNRNYQIALGSWIAQFEDPISILERFKDPHHLKNYPGWGNSEYNHFVDERSFDQAEMIFANEMPIAPIYHWLSPALSSPRIENIGITSCGGVLFDRYSLQKKER